MPNSQDARIGPVSSKVLRHPPGGRLIAQDHIRLLEIHPGNPVDPIQANLFSTKLSEAPQYEALSYTWGSSADMQRIDITYGSADGDRAPPVLVTTNCYSALRRLRWCISRPRIVWIDAICINQEDVNERNHQLSLMTQIYKNATCVIVYLGESGDGSDEAMDWIKEIDSPSDNVIRRSEKRQFSFSSLLSHVLQVKTENETLDQDMEEEHDEPNADMEYILPPDKSAMRALFNRPYFSRVWVLQEIHMSQRATVYCGNRTVDWTSFMAFKDWNVSMKMLPELPYIITARRDRYKYYTPPGALALALQDTRNCNATDPRDRLYAILPLLQQVTREGSKRSAKAYNSIKMDYRLTTTEVFVDLAAYFLKDFGLQVLDAVTGPSMLPNLPSWVPDWSMPSSTKKRDRFGDHHSHVFGRSQRFSPGGYKLLHFESSGKEYTPRLQIKGRCVGTITSFGSECDLSKNKFPLSGWFAMVPDITALSDSYKACRTTRNVIINLISARGMRSADIVDIIEERIKVYHEGPEARTNFIEHMERDPTNDGTSLREFIECGFFATIFEAIQDILWACDRMRLIQTDSGYVGLGSMYCQIGDRVYLAEGVKKCYVLRPKIGINERNGNKVQVGRREGAGNVTFVGGCSFRNPNKEVTMKDADVEKLIIW